MYTAEQETLLRNAVADAGRRLVRENLVQGTWGNISVRLDETHMIVTPSGLDYLSLTPGDMVVVDMNTMEYSGTLKPTSEKKLHAAILLSRQEINAVIHNHSEYCCIAAAARIELPAQNPDMQRLIGDSARCAAYALPGTKKMTSKTLEALEGRNGCYLANHGAIAMGASIEEAFAACRSLERSTKEYIEKKAGL